MPAVAGAREARDGLLVRLGRVAVDRQVGQRHLPVVHAGTGGGVAAPRDEEAVHLPLDVLEELVAELGRALLVGGRLDLLRLRHPDGLLRLS